MPVLRQFQTRSLPFSHRSPKQAEPAASGVPEPDAENDVSLPAIVLSQSGSVAERALLASSWRDIDRALAGEAWQAKIEGLRLALADAEIWSRDDRHRVFSSLERADRISEAARTAERLFHRYNTSSERSARASRELAGRLALQLYNLRQGMADFAADAPVDALLRVEPALDIDVEGGDAADWYRQLTGMYRQWATKRRMQIKDIGSFHGKSMPILIITGFGAFRTLKEEVGLHVLEVDQKSENTRRIVARVTVVAGPDRGLPTSGEFAAAAQLLTSAPTTKSIVRRYREDPAPIVRDIVGGWRSGRLSAVLGGDFDLIGVIKRQQPAA